ncbi:MAG: hypothetical protein AB1428_09625 [Bacteroidota bacterium]
MAEPTARSKRPGPETLITSYRRDLLEGIEAEGTSGKPAGSGPHPVRGWSESLVTISTGVVAIATLATWFFGGSQSFPKWVLYFLTVFVLIAVYKYSEPHVRRLYHFLSLRTYLRQQRFRLVGIIEGFTDLMSARREDSVPSVIKKMSEKSGGAIVDPDFLTLPYDLLSNILVSLSDAGRSITIREFKGVLNDLSTLVRFCSYFYFKKPLAENKLRTLKAEDRNTLESVRENFADFVRRYQAFHDEMQLRIGTTTKARFDVPQPL